jgi:Spx/MgsR family transcriptional regulator
LSNRKIEILGLKNCDKCRDAQKKLNNLGYDVEFIDVRKNPIGLDQIKELIAMFGNQILNKRSTTFRGLSQSEKELSVVQLLQKYPTLMKRPVVMSSEKNSVGWNAEIIKEWLV